MKCSWHNHLSINMENYNIYHHRVISGIKHPSTWIGIHEKIKYTYISINHGINKLAHKHTFNKE